MELARRKICAADLCARAAGSEGILGPRGAGVLDRSDFTGGREQHAALPELCGYFDQRALRRPELHRPHLRELCRERRPGRGDLVSLYAISLAEGMDPRPDKAAAFAAGHQSVQLSIFR